MHYCWLKSSTLFKCSPQPKLLLFVTVVTVVQWSASRKCQKTRVKPENTWVFLQVFSGITALPALDAGDRRGSLPGLPYCCSAGLTLATVVGEPNCCSVVTVNTSNTVQLLTFDSSSPRAPHASKIEFGQGSTPVVHGQLRSQLTRYRVCHSALHVIHAAARASKPGGAAPPPSAAGSLCARSALASS